MMSIVEENILAADFNTQSLSSSSSSFSIARNILDKYDVERNSENRSIEDLLRVKIDESVVENEAFYIIDLGAVVRKYEEWVTNLPRVKPFFAIKCNPNTAIIKLLGNLGANFDCASKSEIQQILGCGISGSRIIFANPCKMKSHLEYAKSSNVDLMTFDNDHELIKIAETFPAAKLVLRIITDDSQSVCRFSTKFGAPLDSTFQLLSLAKELNLNVVGVSFHVGSGCMSSSSFVSAIRSAYGVFKQGEQLGFKFNLLDLGGGWPGTNTDRISFPVIASVIRPLLDELFPVEDGVEIIAEPGRYFVSESHTIAVNIYAKRTMINSSTGNNQFLYYVNDGVYQSFNCILFDHYTPTPSTFKTSSSSSGRSSSLSSSISSDDHVSASSSLYSSTIFGPTCDSMDCIGKDVPLPELNVGDWIYFKNMGAYSIAAASSFNGFKSHPSTFYYY